MLKYEWFNIWTWRRINSVSFKRKTRKKYNFLLLLTWRIKLNIEWVMENTGKKLIFPFPLAHHTTTLPTEEKNIHPFIKKCHFYTIIFFPSVVSLFFKLHVRHFGVCNQSRQRTDSHFRRFIPFCHVWQISSIIFVTEAWMKRRRKRG